MPFEIGFLLIIHGLIMCIKNKSNEKVLNLPFLFKLFQKIFLKNTNPLFFTLK